VGDSGSPWKVFLGKQFRVRVGYEFHAVVSTTSSYGVQLAFGLFLGFASYLLLEDSCYPVRGV